MAIVFLKYINYVIEVANTNKYKVCHGTASIPLFQGFSF